MNTTLKVDGMHCNSCATSIDLELEDMAGIQSVKANYDTGSVDVSYDPEQVTEADMAKAIASLGFEVVS